MHELQSFSWGPEHRNALTLILPNALAVGCGNRLFSLDSRIVIRLDCTDPCHASMSLESCTESSTLLLERGSFGLLRDVDYSVGEFWHLASRISGWSS